MSTTAHTFTDHIVNGAIDMAQSAAMMNGRDVNFLEPGMEAVAKYVATATIAYLNHLAERHDALPLIEEFYQRVARGIAEEADR